MHWLVHPVWQRVHLRVLLCLGVGRAWVVSRMVVMLRLFAFGLRVGLAGWFGSVGCILLVDAWFCIGFAWLFLFLCIGFAFAFRLY